MIWTVIKLLVPPVFVRVIKSIRGLYLDCDRIQWKGGYKSWEEARQHAGSYSDPHILKKVRDAAAVVRRGQASFERDGVLFFEPEISWPISAALLLAAALSGGRLSVLDFGGSLGSSYFQNKVLIDSLADVKWGIVEQSTFVQAGREDCVDHDRLSFFSDIAACKSAVQPNVVLLASVLQYLERPYEVLDQLSRIDANILLIDRTLFSNIAGKERIFVQEVPARIYKARYPCWALDRSRVIQELQLHGYSLLADFSCAEGNIDDAEFRGLLFQKVG